MGPGRLSPVSRLPQARCQRRQGLDLQGLSAIAGSKRGAPQPHYVTPV